MSLGPTYSRTMNGKRWTLTPTSQSSVTAQATQDVWTYSGFGYNDPVYKRNPTGGTFVKTTRRLLTGRRDIFYGNPALGYLSVIGPDPNTGYGMGITPTSVDLTPADNRAIDWLNRRIESGNPNLLGDSNNPDLLVFLGESKETKEMVKQAAKAARHVVKTAQKVAGDVFKKGNAVKRMAEAWLAYTYGWKPALGDIYNLLNYTSRFYSRTRFSATAKEMSEVRDSRWLNGNTGQVLATTEGYWIGRIKYSIECSVSDMTAFDLGNITSLDPKIIAWELMPLSFVVDWFVDVGGYLAAQEAALGNGLTFYKGTKTVTTIREHRPRLRGAWFQKSGSYTNYHSWNYDGYERVVTKARSVLTAFPRPFIPTVKVDLGWRRVLSAGALIEMAFGNPGGMSPNVMDWNPRIRSGRRR